MVRLTLTRLGIASILAGVVGLCGCSDIASVGISVTGDPLSVSLTIKGPSAYAPSSLTVPAGTVLSFPPAGTPPIPVTATGPVTAKTPALPAPATIPAGTAAQTGP